MGNHPTPAARKALKKKRKRADQRAKQLSGPVKVIKPRGELDG